jgi:hypothetical protein
MDKIKPANKFMLECEKYLRGLDFSDDLIHIILYVNSIHFGNLTAENFGKEVGYLEMQSILKRLYN